MNIQTQAARNTDPDTSHLAAQIITESGKRGTDQDKVLAVVIDCDHYGLIPMTGGEVANLLFDRYPLDRWTREKALKRLGDLKGIKVMHGERRACTALENHPVCVTWELK